MDSLLVVCCLTDTAPEAEGSWSTGKQKKLRTCPACYSIGDVILLYLGQSSIAMLVVQGWVRISMLRIILLYVHLSHPTYSSQSLLGSYLIT